MAIQELNKAEIESVSGGLTIFTDLDVVGAVTSLLGGSVRTLLGDVLGAVTGLLDKAVGAAGGLGLGTLLGGLLGGLLG